MSKRYFIGLMKWIWEITSMFHNSGKVIDDLIVLIKLRKRVINSWGMSKKGYLREEMKYKSVP